MYQALYLYDVASINVSVENKNGGQKYNLEAVKAANCTAKFLYDQETQKYQ